MSQAPSGDVVEVLDCEQSVSVVVSWMIASKTKLPPRDLTYRLDTFEVEDDSDNATPYCDDERTWKGEISPKVAQTIITIIIIIIITVIIIILIILIIIIIIMMSFIVPSITTVIITIIITVIIIIIILITIIIIITMITIVITCVF
jgi:uncharacterized protein YqhQ